MSRTNARSRCFQLHPTLRFFPMAMLLAACPQVDDASLQCGTGPAITPHGLHIETWLLQATRSHDDPPTLHGVEVVDCADVVVTVPDSSWQFQATTPAEVDLPPGPYTVDVAWEDGSCSYTADPVSCDLDVDDGIELVSIPLCVDLTGAWTCEHDGRSWSMQAEMDGCAADLVGADSEVRIRGNYIEGEGVTGVVDPTCGRLDLDVDDLDWVCWRAE